MALRRHGFNVLVAKDGAEGLRMFREDLDIINLVLQDMMMPLMGGEESFQSGDISFKTE
jgi:DNA-binding response OmpR family regulator